MDSEMKISFPKKIYTKEKVLKKLESFPSKENLEFEEHTKDYCIKLKPLREKALKEFRKISAD
jgi:hypothetical protein